MITGANSGIGKVIAKRLAGIGATVVMVCRNRSKGELALREIKNETSNDSVDLMLADLSSLESVRQLAKDFLQKYEKLHVLVNNAGLILGNRVATPDGLESTFVVNYLSHFLLTNLLLGTLKASAPSRVVNITSDAHFSGHIDFDDPQGEKHYGGLRAYSQSKLAQVVFTYELAKRTMGSGVSVNCVHPGAVRTKWGNGAGLLEIGIRIARPFMLSPEKGAETPIYVATSAEVKDVTGKYFSKKKESESSKESYDANVSKKLWELSDELTKLR